jgi:hypothetical protein
VVVVGGADVVAGGVEVEVAGGADVVVVGGAGFWVANMAAITTNTTTTTTIAIAVVLEIPRVMKSIILSTLYSLSFFTYI